MRPSLFSSISALVCIWAFVAIASPAFGDEMNGWNLHLFKANGDVYALPTSPGISALFQSTRACKKAGIYAVSEQEDHVGFICKPHYIKTNNSVQ